MGIRLSRADVASSPWPFFLLAVGWSWLSWIPIALSGQDVTTLPALLPLALGGLGPALSALALTCLAQGRKGWRDYWRRVFDPWRISRRWYAVILLLAPLYSALALITGALVTGALPRLETALGYLHHPLTLIPFAVFTLLYGPLPEELGWRGYALDRLQARYSALGASLLLGVIWSAWHLPMFFMRGSLVAVVFPLGSARFWLAFGPGILAESVVMTWIYNNTGRSTLSAILFHTMMNLTGELLSLPGSYKNYQFLWLVIIAALVLAVWGPRTLTRPMRRTANGR